VGDFYEKYMRFGLVLSQLAVLKKKWGVDYEHFLRAVSFMSSGAKYIFFFKVV
jgi:hypothetical protein